MRKGTVGSLVKHDLVLNLFLLLLFTIPFSIPMDLGNHQINLPSEVLVGTIAAYLIFALKLGKLRSSGFLTHPISIASLVYLGWQIIGIPLSSEPLVSLKYVVVGLTHWWVFYVGFWFLANRGKKDLVVWLDWYNIGFCLVIFYALINNYRLDFRPDASVLLAQPFYQDHALFGAVITMLIFSFLFRLQEVSQRGFFFKWQFLLTLMFCLVALLALYLIPSRAALLSLVVVLCIGLICIVFKWKYKLGLAVLLLAVLSASLLLSTLFTDPVDAQARTGNMQEQIESTFNFTSDISNLERLNRYYSAWRMFLDRPLLGFGPGTFALAYLPYQKEEQMTRISVTKPMRDDGSPHPEGRGGGAHSEYLQALAEGGLMGFLSWLALVFATVFIGLRHYFRLKDQRESIYVLSVMLGLLTYFVHGLFNNFLHQEELAVLFWMMLAFIVKKDLEHLPAKSI